MNKIRSILKIRKKKTLISLGIIIILSGLVFFITHTLSKPAIGVVNQAISQTQFNEAVKLKDFKSQYFSTQYSGRYDLQVNQNKSASLESWVLLAHQVLGQGPASKIAVSVTNLSAGGVKEDSAYKQFEAFPNLYTISKATYNLDEVIIADRSDPNFEQTSLWAHKPYLLTISMTSGQKSDQLLSEMDTFLGHLTWSK